jgi:FkbM family methyltransferase
MHLTPRQRVSWFAHLYKAATRQHHGELRPLFAPHVPPDGVVIDIGAHAGQFSKLFARMAWRGGVYAFEPSAYARSIMEPALRFNRIGNVTLAPVGLSDKAASLTLHTPLKRSTALGFGVAHLGPAGEKIPATVDQSVDLTTLDAFVAAAGFTRVDLIKADVEGWEMRALKGGENTLKRFHPALYLEIDDAFLARAGDTPDALFEWLGALGYSGYTTPNLQAAPRWIGAGDYLFTAEKRPCRP